MATLVVFRQTRAAFCTPGRTYRRVDRPGLLRFKEAKRDASHTPGANGSAYGRNKMLCRRTVPVCSVPRRQSETLRIPREQTDRRLGVIRCYVGEPSRFAPLQGGKARRFAYHADAPSDTFCQTGMRAADDLNAHFDNPIEEPS